jgi:hypothetical protein
MDFTKMFSNAGSAIMNNFKKTLPITCGLPQSLLSTTNNRYVVRIQAIDGKSYNITVYAFLQDNFKFNVDSTWDKLGMPKSIQKIGQIGQVITQGTTGKQLYNAALTRRVWTDSSPIKLELKLKFEAVENVFKEVIQPCVYLQSLVLPRHGSTLIDKATEAFSLIPPGPNPARWSETHGSIAGVLGASDGTIGISIGDFVEFNCVIIKSVQIDYGTRMAQEGPVSAEVVVNIETYEMLLQEDLIDAHKVSGNFGGTKMTGSNFITGQGTNLGLGGANG